MTMSGPSHIELLVVFKFSSVLGWLRPDDLQAVASVELPSHAHELLVDDERRRVYVSIYGNGIYGNNTQAGNQLAVIHLDERRLLSIINLGDNRGAHGLAFDADKNVLVSCDRTASVVVVDADLEKVADVFKIDAWATPHWIISTADGTKAYTSNKATPYVSVLDTKVHGPANQIPTPEGAEGIAISKDESRLFIADHSGSGLPSSASAQPCLHIVDTATDQIASSIPLALPRVEPDSNHELRVAVSPDDKYVLVSAHAWDKVLVVDAAEPSRQQSIDVEGGPMGFAFEPDYGKESRCCLVTNHDIGQISRIDIEEARVLNRRTPLGIEHQGPEVMAFVFATARHT